MAKVAKVRLTNMTRRPVSIGSRVVGIGEFVIMKESSYSSNREAQGLVNRGYLQLDQIEEAPEPSESTETKTDSAPKRVVKSKQTEN